MLRHCTNRLHGARISYTAPTHIFNIKYFFPHIPPVKPVENQPIHWLPHLEDKKRANNSLNFTHQSIALLGKSQPLLWPATHFSPHYLVTAVEAYSETLPGKVASWLPGVWPTCPPCIIQVSHMWKQLQTDVKTAGEVFFNGGFQNNMRTELTETTLSTA